MRTKAALACVDCGQRNYHTSIKKDNQTERLELKKFCKTCSTHTLHRQTK